MAPAPNPVSALAANNWSGVSEKPETRLPPPIIARAATSEVLRPQMSDSLPLISWMLVLVMRKEAPTKDMEAPVLRADAIAGRLVDMDV